MYHYTDHDIARMYHEPAKRSMLVSHQDERGPFARDRARVLHSAALRWGDRCWCMVRLARSSPFLQWRYYCRHAARG